MNLNQVTLVGRTVQKPELKTSTTGTMVTSFSIAINQVTGSGDQRKENTEYVDLVAFGKSAEVITQWLQKGQLFSCVGRLKTTSYVKQGETKNTYRTEVIIEKFGLGPRAGGAAKDDEAPSHAPGEIEYPIEDINPEDIPFSQS